MRCEREESVMTPKILGLSKWKDGIAFTELKKAGRKTLLMRKWGFEVLGAVRQMKLPQRL